MRNKIIVVGGGLYTKPFKGLGKVSTNLQDLIACPEEIALVLFVGGEDVHPSFYGGIDIDNMCVTDYRRDMKEKNIFDYCRKYNIKMTGICRGFQFLNVMAGGAMYQHVTNHGGEDHGIYMPHIGMNVSVTSTHHQLVQLGGGSYPISWADPNRSRVYIGPNGGSVKSPKVEIESAIFPNINAVGVQYHPEFMEEDSSGRIHYVCMMKDFIGTDMDSFIERYAGGEVNDHVRKAGN